MKCLYSRKSNKDTNTDRICCILNECNCNYSGIYLKFEKLISKIRGLNPGHTSLSQFFFIFPKHFRKCMSSDSPVSQTWRCQYLGFFRSVQENWNIWYKCDRDLSPFISMTWGERCQCSRRSCTRTAGYGAVWAVDLNFEL